MKATLVMYCIVLFLMPTSIWIILFCDNRFTWDEWSITTLSAMTTVTYTIVGLLIKFLIIPLYKGKI